MGRETEHKEIQTYPKENSLTLIEEVETVIIKISLKIMRTIDGISSQVWRN